MPFIDDNHLTDDAAHGETGVAQPEIADLLGIARRGWFFMVAGTSIGLICALILLSIIPPSYKATSRIAFERTLPRYLQTNKVTNEPIIDDSDTLGQSYVISSESILLHVIRSLSLANDPDFAGRGKDDKTLGSRVRDVFQRIVQAFGLERARADDQQAIHDRGDPEKVAFDTLVRNLTVAREDVASVLTVAFSWADPVKAAAIVNAIVDTYIHDSIAEKTKSTIVARTVVQQRIDELKQQLKDADVALLEYKMANHLVGSDQLTLSHGQLNVLQTSLTRVQLAMAEAKARMERLAGNPEASATVVPDNEVIKKLRGELLDLSTRENDIERLVGKDHLAAVKLRDRMEGVRQAIVSEQKHVAESFEQDYELAHSQYDRLTAEISNVVNSEGMNNDKVGRLRELEGAQDSFRGLYNRMLAQGFETNRVDAEPSITPDARVLTRATPPLQTESSKKRLLILAGGSVMGLLLGGAILLARDFPFGVFRSSRQVTRATGLPCAVLPAILSADELASLRTGEYVLEWPYSRFAQTLRSIWAMVNLAHRETGAKVVGVMSSNPGEGKTTVAINLAAHFGLRSSTRVLIIDADFHRQSLTKSVVPEARVGLQEALGEPTALAKFVVRKERLNLDVLPCPVPDRMPNAAELLGTPQMKQLIEVARDAYDLVIIEAPPIAAVVDFKMIARHCNGFIFVVEWGKTSQRLVLECLSDASALWDRVLCVALNKADPSALASIEHYKGDSFHAYYSDQKEA
jgi:succinoglycan biosynthesis transport protein ExoP